MNEAYRQKLLHWFMSMLLCMSLPTFLANWEWFYDLPKSYLDYGEYDLEWSIWGIGEAVIYFAFYFIIVAPWHLFDFLQRENPDSLWKERLAEYRTFCSVVLATMMLSAVEGTSIFNHNSCDELPEAMFTTCYITMPKWLEWSSLAAIFLALLLVVAKAGISISTWFSERK
ncbi:hypothetical protein [Aurantiacibacter gangjinensis]|uniref:Uncharacterized protein n=1 Tax=Aurantiacibacter gangjinensis TaxID=502682 RepID=A0A0G9MPL5_9SPHN|nr:hypothetical protein [Aurantiacibacter gangjinensis]KLE32657.1 hypothetical protein AAW01_00950 [Aurantiacibacter gangjinensis]